MEKFPLTRAGYEGLQKELSHLKQVERPEIIKAIEAARKHGDLSENAEYHAAREKQGYIEGRIKEVEFKVGHAEVIDVVRAQEAKDRAERKLKETSLSEKQVSLYERLLEKEENRLVVATRHKKRKGVEVA